MLQLRHLTGARPGAAHTSVLNRRQASLASSSTACTRSAVRGPQRTSFASFVSAPPQFGAERGVRPGTARSTRLVSGMVAHAGASSSSPAAHDVAGDIDVEMVVDPMCPWCYIGLKRLHGAVEAAKAEGISVAVRFSPYVFDPETPVPHLGWRDYVALRYPDRAEFIYTQKLPYTISQAASVGLSFPDYDKRLISPTVASLSLLHIARQLGGEVEAKVVEQIFLQHFCKGRDTGDLQVLEDCLVEGGVDRAHARAALSRGDGKDWVMAEDARVRRELGVSGVPHYVVSSTQRVRPEGTGKKATGPSRILTVSGAQPEEVFLRAFRRLKQEQQ